MTLTKNADDKDCNTAHETEQFKWISDIADWRVVMHLVVNDNPIDAVVRQLDMR